MSSDDEDAATVRPGETLRALLRVEVARYAAAGVDDIANVLATGRCLLCPFKKVARRRDFERHMKHHCEKNAFTLSGKQLRLIKSMYDTDLLAGISKETYLAESAAIIRATVTPALADTSFQGAKLDKGIVLVQDINGPFFANRDTVIKDGLTRHVGRVFFTKEFAEFVFREMLYSLPVPMKIYDRFVKHISELPCVTTGLVTRFFWTWNRIFEDIWRSPLATRLQARCRASLLADREFQHISIDCTVRVIRRVVGQVDYRAPAEDRNAALFPDGEAKRKVMSVMGRSSTCLAMIPVRDESADEFARVFQDAFLRAELDQVMTIRCDHPTRPLLEALLVVCPHLQVIASDTVHPAMNYEYAFGRKRPRDRASFGRSSTNSTCSTRRATLCPGGLFTLAGLHLP